MNRISTASLTFCSIFFAITACSSGGDEPDDGTGNGGSASGGTTGTAGTPSNSAGSSTAGSGSAGSGTAGTGTAGGGAASGPSVCDDSTFALPLAEAYVDNFEDDTRFLGWYAFSDTTVPDMPKPERVQDGALSTGYAGKVGATGIKSSKMMGYGAGFGFGLVDPAKGACVDLTAFDGISLWAKGTAGADDSLKFQIVSPSTQPADSMPVGDCPTSASPCAFKHPAKIITLTAEWQQYVIKFSELTPAAAYTGKVLGFNLITDGPAYDAQIDEVTFYKDMAPTGPVMPVTGEGGASAL